MDRLSSQENRQLQGRISRHIKVRGRLEGRYTVDLEMLAKCGPGRTAIGWIVPFECTPNKAMLDELMD